MRRFVRENSLTLAFLALFLGALVGQAFVGHSDFNHDQVAHQDETVSLGRYVTSSAYWVDVMENWQSEYLQFTLFILGTVWLVQRGSPESKQLGEAGRSPTPSSSRRAREPRLADVGEGRRLADAGVLELARPDHDGDPPRHVVRAVRDRARRYNSEQLDHHEAALSLWQYAGSSDFWNRTLQNWQSEFLAVASMAIFSIWLRERGSPESKPVGAPRGDRRGGLASLDGRDPITR